MNEEERHQEENEENEELRLYTCYVCYRGFHNEAACEAHVINDHPPKDEKYVFKCTQCSVIFAHASNLYRHKKAHETDLFRCSKCPYSFKLEETLVIHVTREHNNRRDEILAEVCDTCNKEFVNDIELKRHEYYCKNKEKICQKRKEQKEIRRQHDYADIPSTSTWTDGRGRSKKDKSCPYCGDIFASMQSRTRHIGRKHPEKINDSETTTHVYLVVETPHLPFACEKCGKRFASSASCQTHKKRIHAKKLEFVCKICEKGYPLGSELRKHMIRVHNTKNLEIFPKGSDWNPSAERTFKEENYDSDISSADELTAERSDGEKSFVMEMESGDSNEEEEKEEEIYLDGIFGKELKLRGFEEVNVDPIQEPNSVPSPFAALPDNPEETMVPKYNSSSSKIVENKRSMMVGRSPMLPPPVKTHEASRIQQHGSTMGITLERAGTSTTVNTGRIISSRYQQNGNNRNEFQRQAQVHKLLLQRASPNANPFPFRAKRDDLIFNVTTTVPLHVGRRSTREQRSVRRSSSPHLQLPEVSKEVPLRNFRSRINDPTY